MATWDADAHALTVFAVNRSLTEPADLELDLTRLPGHLELTEHLMLGEDDPTLTNTKNDPDRVRPRPGRSTLDGRGAAQPALPGLLALHPCQRRGGDPP